MSDPVQVAAPYMPTDAEMAVLAEWFGEPSDGLSAEVRRAIIRGLRILTLEDAVSPVAENEKLARALDGMIAKWAGHSGSCCVQVDGLTTVTRESCKCGPIERAAHEARDWYGWVHDLNDRRAALKGASS